MSPSSDSDYDSIRSMGELYDVSIEHLFDRCGFGLKAVYGNFDRSELSDSSPEMIFVAERH